MNIYDNRNAFSSQQKEACCIILNFKTKRVKEFNTLETYRELSYIGPAMG